MNLLNYAPYVPYVPYTPSVPMPLCLKTQRALNCNVPTCLRALIFHVPTCLHAYIYFSCLRAFVP